MDDLIQQIEDIKQTALMEIKAAQDSSDIQLKDEIFQKYLGRKQGKLNSILKRLKDLPVEQRPKIGEIANLARKEIEETLESVSGEGSSALSGLAGDRGKSSFQDWSKIDLSLPGDKKIETGHYHPLTQMKDKVVEVFRSMGFEILEGREMENDYYNFTALNIPEDHPARDMWDTFWIKHNSKLSSKRTDKDNNDQGKGGEEKKLLRTHTSGMQVRIMEKRTLPLKVCLIGKCFRHEATDASHEHTLYQIEGIVIDKQITIANLIHILKSFLDELFGQAVKIRLRPSYFPFTEPSYEVDFGCLNCNGKGCPVCQQSGWVEILGCGMIHPKVFESANRKLGNYPPGEQTGFAFGIGLDRLAMMKYQVDNIRWFHSGDLRFIKQF